MELAERTNLVTSRGKPLTLLGPALSAGDPAPDFRVVDASFQPVGLKEFAGRVLLISAVPSLETSVCALQTTRFNQEIAALPPEVGAITISMDLPFAQKRFCETQRIDRMPVLSDHIWREFGTRYGVLTKETGLLARSVFVIGRDGRIRYLQIVAEISQQPDHDAALAAARAAMEERP